MATGRLGVGDLTAATNATIYTVPSGYFAVVGVNVCNRGNTAVAIRIATAATDTPTNSEYIEYDVEVGAKGVLERTGIILSAGQKIVARSSAANVSVVVFGIETSTT